MAINYHGILAWPFETVEKDYTEADTVAFARAVGAGLQGEAAVHDVLYTDSRAPRVLPGMAVALADGEFWQQHPQAGIQWRHVVHAEEAVTVHHPLPSAGRIVVRRKVDEIYDRGPGRGASIRERQVLADAAGRALVTIEVTTIALRDGGFGGPAAPRGERIAIPDSPADATLMLTTPAGPDAVFRLPDSFAVAGAGDEQGQVMLRGLCGFGMLSRAAVILACDNRPERLRRLAVRYAGPLYCDEIVRAELWHSGPGRAVMQLWAVERNALILTGCELEYVAATDT